MKNGRDRWWQVLSACGALLMAAPAAADPAGWTFVPPQTTFDDWTATLGASAGADAWAGRQSGAGLAAKLAPDLARQLDNGWEIGARGSLLVWHDRLDGDFYGDRFVEKAFLFARTPYGRLELGEDDGAACKLALNGPFVDPAVGIDNAEATFFRNPRTGRALIDLFRLRSLEAASSNDAKLTYLSPRWFGLAAGASFTPDVAHDALPFIARAAAGRPRNLLEAGLNDAGRAGPVSYTLYGGLIHGDAAPGARALLDWAIGGQADMGIGSVRLAAGGGARWSDADAYDTAAIGGHTGSWRLAMTAKRGPWVVGVERAGGTARPGGPAAALEEQGSGASLGYVVNADLQLTAGWQELRFARATGVLPGGPPRQGPDAGFLRLAFHI